MTANGEVNVKQRMSNGKHRDAEGDDAFVNVNIYTEQGEFYDNTTHAGAFVIHTVHIITINTAAKKNAHSNTI
jgi:hypothetical protein